MFYRLAVSRCSLSCSSTTSTTHSQTVFAVFGLALSAFICLGTNIVGYCIAVATKTHKITDLIVRSLDLVLLVL